MGACAQFAVFTYAEMRRTPRYEIRLAAFYADNLMNSVAHCGWFYLRDIVEEKCRLRPACRKLPGLNREKTRITPRLSETSESSPNLCVHSSSSYVSPSMLPLSSGDLIEWSLVCHSTLSYQKFCDRHSNHYDHPEELHQSVE